MLEHYQALDPCGANHVALTPLSFLKRTADIFAGREAVIYGNRRYTWEQVYARARRLASALASRGIGRGDTVAVVAANTPEMIECHYGVAMCGAVLNTINTRLEADTIAYILEHGDARVLITDSGFAGSVGKALAQMAAPPPVIDIVDDQAPTGDRLGDCDYETLLAGGDPNHPWQAPADEWDALALNYTSGTSGRPKGVVYHHRGSYLMTLGTATAWSLPMHPVYLYTVPMFHCNGWGHAWTMTVVAGTIVCCRQVSARAVFDAVADHRVTHFGGAPVVLAMLANAPAGERRAFEHPVRVMTAGAPPPAAVIERTRALGFEVMQVYGLTETYGHITQCLWREEWNDLPLGEQAEVQSWQGVSLPMVEDVAVLELETDAAVERDGVTQGEIAIRGNTVMKGYYKNPAATGEAFRGGWFRSGDAAVWRDNGYIQIRDRLKDVIISGGENVSSVEVEGVIYRHPAVAAAAVVARPDDKWGEVPCAFVELKPEARLAAKELVDFCRQHLAGFKTPRHVIFGELPKTATGKIQKYLLREQARNAARTTEDGESA